MEPLRVCVDARLAGGRSGGVEQVVIGVAAGLSRLKDDDERYLFLTEPRRHEWIRPYLSGPCEPLPPRLPYPLRRGRAIVLGLRERMPGGLAHAVRRSDGTLEAAGADVVHFPFQDALLTDVPSIYQPHDLQHLHLPELFSERARVRREVVYRAHCERAATIVSMTSWGRLDLLDRYGLAPEKVAVVPGASILPEYPSPTEADFAALRARLKLPSGFLLYPAQTWPHKNHERLLEALALIRDREGVAIPLVCPGRKTTHFRRIAERMRELRLEETTAFPGFVSTVEMRTLYALARGLVFPSRFEGWGLPVCEAFSAALPLACSNATGLPDMVGNAGLLFDPLDVEQMADRFWRLWSDEGLRGELTERGRERDSLFSFDRTARLFRAHYRQVGGHELTDEDRILLAAPPPA